MKSALLVVLLAAAATAAVISNEMPDVVRVPDVDEVADVVRVPDVDEVADVAEELEVDEEADEDINDFPEAFVNDVDELTDTADLTDEVETPAQNAVFTRRNLNLGNVTAGDTQVVNRVFQANGTAGISKVKIIQVRTNRPISAIRVNPVGDSQNATPAIIAGGIGRSYAVIRIKSARGRGYHYRVEVYVK